MSAYRIQSGDTLSRIAQRYHTTVGALAQANHLQDPNKIIAGRSLNIPGSRDEFVPSSGRAGGGRTGGTQGTQGTQGAAPTGPAPQGQVGQWIEQARAELQRAGVDPSKMDPRAIAAIIQHESSGNPNAQNNWDSNARRGTPSIGLMQTIQPTFDAHKLPGHDNIRNPVDNIIAGVRYAISRYGSVSNVPGLRAMAGGGGYVGY